MYLQRQSQTNHFIVKMTIVILKLLIHNPHHPIKKLLFVLSMMNIVKDLNHHHLLQLSDVYIMLLFKQHIHQLHLDHQFEQILIDNIQMIMMNLHQNVIPHEIQSQIENNKFYIQHQNLLLNEHRQVHLLAHE